VKAVIWIAGVGSLCALLGAGQPAFAQLPLPAQPQPPNVPPQGPAQRPVRPLFGVGTGSFEQSLSGGISFGAGYDVERTTFRAALGPGDEVETNGPSGFGNVRLLYSASGGRFSGGASVRGAGFYYRRVSTDVRVNSGASVHGGVRLWRSATVDATHDVTYAPYHFAALSPAEVLEQQQANPFFDPSTLVQSSLHQRTSVSFQQPMPLSRRVSTSWGYGFFGDRRGELRGHQRHELHAAMTIGLTRGIRARLGYHYAVGRSHTSGAPGPWADIHNIDSGIDVSRQLALSRQLGLSFRTGLATIGDGRTTHFTMTGGVRLNWAISRTWNASTGFNRDAQFYDDLQAAAVSNRVQVAVGGAITRRLLLHGRLGMSSMDQAIGTGDNRVRWTHGSVGLSTNLSALVSIGVDYSNSYYSFGDDIVLFPGVPQYRHRQSVHGRVTVFAPLYAVTRRR